VHRALAALTGGAFLTLVIGSVGSGDPYPVLLLGAMFTLLGIAGFAWVRRRAQLGWAVVYVAVQLASAIAVFAHTPGVGSTLLLVALVSQCVLLLPLAGTALVIALVPFLHAGMPLPDALREGFGLLASVLFGAIVTELLRREQRARTELAQAHEQLRDHAAQAERLATSQERNRVARDIHDGLGHSLTVVQMQVKAARALLTADPAKTDAVLAKAQHQAEAALGDVRRSVHALREPRSVPPLAEALRELAEETSAAGVLTRLTVSGAERALPDQTREALFRAAQEGLTNVRKHARATRADLELAYSDSGVRIAVCDDGVGFSGAGSPGFGLLGLRERAAQVGGRLHLESARGRGCTVSMEVPR
jgi:signal transduction histidine kinase